MKRTSIIFILLASLIGGLFWYGNSLPDLYRNSTSHTYNRPAEYVWQLIFDFKQYPQWRENVYSVEEIPNTSKYGEWKEINEDGDTTHYKLLTFEQNTYITIEETGRKAVHSGTLHFKVNSSEDGKFSTLTILEERHMPDLSPRILNHLLGTSSKYINAYFRSIDYKIAGEMLQAKKASSQLPIKIKAPQ